MMTAPEIPEYSFAERDRRWALARRLMEEEELDALLVHGEREGTGPAPFCFDTYFTNDRPGATVIFPRDGDPVSLVSLPMYASDHFESRLRRDALWLRADQLRFPRSPDTVAAVLKERGIDNGAVGVIGAEPYPPYYFVPPMPSALDKGLADQLPHLTLKPVAHRFAELAYPQSEEELAVIRYAAAVGDEMAQAMVDVTRPGVPESEIYAAGMTAAFHRGIAAPGMLLWSGPEFIAWGTPAWVYRPQAPRIVEDGDVILAEVFVSLGMKETQHQVAISVGDVHEDFHHASEAARASYEAGLEALRPGRTFGTVVDAMRAPIEQAGGGFVHPVVHGLNPFGPVSGVPLALASIPEAKEYRVHAAIPPILHDLVLHEGMTFALEPNCALGRRVANIGGTVVVGEKGAIELNPFTARMHEAEEAALALR
jgi:Xaa-Pro aminopeptidase